MESLYGVMHATLQLILLKMWLLMELWDNFLYDSG